MARRSASVLRLLVVLMLLLAAGLVAGWLVLHSGGSGRGSPTVQRYPKVTIPQSQSAAPRPGVVTPEDFGAVGDGVHDDGPAVQAALNAAHGRTVQLTSGATYLSSAALELPSNTTLTGTSTSVLTFTWQHTTDADSGGPYYLGNTDQTGGNSDIVLEGFAIRGAADGLPAGPMDTTMRNVPAIRLRKVNTFEMKGLDVSNAPGISILYQGCVHGLLTDNHVHDSGRDGITGTSLGTDLADITVSDNLIERVGDDGIAIAGATVRQANSSVLPTDITITHNRVFGWPTNPNGVVIGRGIALLAVTNVKVTDNQIDRTAGAGILLIGAPDNKSINPLTRQPWYSSNVTITGNTIQSAAIFAKTSTLPSQYVGKNGLQINQAQLVTAQGNTIGAAVGDDISVHDCDECNVQSDPRPSAQTNGAG